MSDAPHNRPLPLAIEDTARYLATLRDHLPMFVVCDHPSDFPELVVARLHLTLPRHEPMPFMIAFPTLEEVQAVMQALGLVKLARSEGDNPVIVESWI